MSAGRFVLFKTAGSAARTDSSGLLNSPIAVADAPLSAAAASLTFSQGLPFNGIVASFTDADPNAMVSDYSASEPANANRENRHFNLEFSQSFHPDA